MQEIEAVKRIGFISCGELKLVSVPAKKIPTIMLDGLENSCGWSPEDSHSNTE